MNGFRKVRVTEQAKVLMGQSPSSSTCSENGEGLPFIQGNAEFGVRYPVPQLRCSAPTRIAEAGDLLLSVRAPVGELNQTSTQTVIGRGLSAIRFQETDRAFAWHALKWSVDNLGRVAQGSTFVAVSRQDVENLEIPWCESNENKRIAAVLDTIDEAIAKTEAVIAKLKQVRAGLLHDLLTRGLDENGQLRDPIAHPEQFQDSPIGRIPGDWDFESLGTRLQRNAGIIQTGPFGSQLHAHEYTMDGVPVVMPQDILEGSFNDAKIARIPTTKAEELRRHRLRLGDLIFARRGDLSRCAAVTEREIGWLCGTGCLLMRFEQVTLSPSWFSLAYRHDFGQRQIAERAVGTTMVNLNTTLLAHLVFAFPIKEEQEDVVRRVADADTLVQTESANLAKLNLLKSALMADLLTGRVRVPADLDFG